MNAEEKVPPPSGGSALRPADAACAAALFVGALLTSFPWSLRGFGWTESSWNFHFGARLLAGEFPYRDYVFQVGFIPILADALFQRVSGSSYAASLACAHAVKFGVALAAYILFRRASSPVVSLGLSLGICALQPLIHNFSPFHAELFLLIGTILWAAAAEGRGSPRTQALLAAAGGFSLALTFGAHQGIALIASPVVFAAFALACRGRRSSGALFAAVAGFTAGACFLAAALFSAGTLEPAVRQLFLDMGEKKSLQPVPALLEALSGGLSAVFTNPGVVASENWPRFAVWGSAAPLILLAGGGARIGQANGSRLETRAWRAWVVPFAFLIGILASQLCSAFPSEIARVVGALGTYYVTLGFLYLAALGLAKRGLDGSELPSGGRFPLPIAGGALGYVWANQLAWPGEGYWTRGWANNLFLAIFMLVWIQRDPRLSLRARNLFLGSYFGILASAFLLKAAWFGFNAEWILADGPRAQLTETIDHPALAGIRVTPEKRRVFEALEGRIPKGSSCFIYGSAPVLYTLLECRNPTRIDSTYIDFFTKRDAQDAVRALLSNPPDFILAVKPSPYPPVPTSREEMRAATSLEASTGYYLLEIGVRWLLIDYDLAFQASDWIDPEATFEQSGDYEQLGRLKLFRRVRSDALVDPPEPLASALRLGAVPPKP